MNYTALGYEENDGTFTVKLDRNGEIYYVDVWIDKKYKDVDCDWNQYIFTKGDEDRKEVQADNDEFDDATSTAICYLESEGVIKQDDKANWHSAEEADDLGDFDIQEKPLTYNVSLLGYDAENKITDFDKEVESFNNKKAAIECAEFLEGHLFDLVDSGKIAIPEEVKYVHVVVDCELDDGNVDILSEEEIEVK